MAGQKYKVDTVLMKNTFLSRKIKVDRKVTKCKINLKRNITKAMRDVSEEQEESG